MSKPLPALRWTLFAAGILGLLVCVTAIPTAFGVLTGHAKIAYAVDAFWPVALRWLAVSRWAVDAMVGGALVAALFATGRPVPIITGVCAMSLMVVFHVGFADGAYWWRLIASTGDASIFTIMSAVWAATLLVTSIVALTTSVKMAR